MNYGVSNDNCQDIDSFIINYKLGNHHNYGEVRRVSIDSSTDRLYVGFSMVMNISSDSSQHSKGIMQSIPLSPSLDCGKFI